MKGARGCGSSTPLQYPKWYFWSCVLLVLLSFVYVQPTRPNGWLVFLCWVMPGAAITIHAKCNCIKNLCTFRCATYLAACWIRLSLCKMQISCHLLVCSDPKVLICANTSCLQCLPMQHVPPPPHKGQRIGEAQNPGPEDMAAFNLAIVNPTAIRNKMQDFLHLKHLVFAMNLSILLSILGRPGRASASSDQWSSALSCLPQFGNVQCQGNVKIYQRLVVTYDDSNMSLELATYTHAYIYICTCVLMYILMYIISI